MTVEDDLLGRIGVNLQHFIVDNFMSHDHLTTAVTQTGSTSIRMCDTNLQTGIQSGSTARLNYTYPLFNPLYSKLYLQTRLYALSDVFAYFGFVEEIDTPTIDMTQSHAGIFIKDDVVYWSTGDGAALSPNYKNTPITQLDVTRDIIYMLESYKMKWYPTPLVQPYFSKMLPETGLRKWSNEYSNGSCIPKDTTHYFMWYIENETGLNKEMFIKKFVFAEDYVD